MRGPVCGHRLMRAKRACKQFQVNAINDILRAEYSKAAGYWHLRALQPDYCGEFGELTNPLFAGFNHLTSKDAAEVARVSKL